MDWNYAASESYIQYPGREKDSSAYLGIFKGQGPIIVIMRYSSQFGVYITLQCCGTRAGEERPGRAGCHASTTHVTTGRTFRSGRGLRHNKGIWRAIRKLPLLNFALDS